MSREDGLKRVHINMFAEDHEWYMQTFGGSTGFSKAIRTVLRDYRKRLEAKAQAIAKPVPVGDIELGEGKL